MKHLFALGMALLLGACATSRTMLPQATPTAAVESTSISVITYDVTADGSEYQGQVGDGGFPVTASLPCSMIQVGDLGSGCEPLSFTNPTPITITKSTWTAYLVKNAHDFPVAWASYTGTITGPTNLHLKWHWMESPSL